MSIVRESKPSLRALPDDAPLAYSMQDAARLASCSVKHLRREVSRGNLQARKSGARILVLRTELNRYLNSLPSATI